MRGGDLYKPKPRKAKIKPESDKRKKEHKRYLQLLREFREECKKNGTYICFFCFIDDGDILVNHHLRKRTGDYYLDKKYFVWVHNDCHIKYHFLPLEKLMKEPWYDEFMERLKEKDDLTYKKELKKQNKIEEYFDF